MLKPGDQVKILPPGEIATVEYAGPTLVEVTGGRWFFHDGEAIDQTAQLRIAAVDSRQVAQTH